MATPAEARSESTAERPEGTATRGTAARALPRDSLRYRLKRALLGPPLRTEQLPDERIGKPTALAVFGSDNLSSAAYASEEALHVLVPAVGVAAFSLVVPISIAVLVILGFLIVSYRQTIKAYPSAGGAYLVTRDNFGLGPAQVAGVALLTDYILTVAVSVAAATAAVTSAVSALEPFKIPVALGFIALVSYGNLRGVRESGRVFSVPTYFFMFNMAVLLAIGLGRMIFGDLPTSPHDKPGMMHFGQEGSGLLMGASFFLFLRAFASGGAAVTGVEAISNGVPAFREPQWKNARTTLTIMGGCLAVMFLGLSTLAARTQVPPYEEGSPTVVAQVGRLVYGESAGGQALYYSLQVATTLILIMAANTSYADFPRLANFQASDEFLPRWLTKRGHRLVFSGGILALAGSSGALVIVSGAEVNRLIPLYALGVFTSFTFSQAGMAKHHLTHKERSWRRGLAINGVGAVLTFVVVVAIGVTKFTQGAWLIVLAVPLLTLLLTRMSRQYRLEAEQLEHHVPEAATAPVRQRHVVLVFVDHLDLAIARAVQYGRTLSPDQIRAVHFVLDPEEGDSLAREWRRLGLGEITLELVDCPDRRIAHSALEVVAADLADGDTEVTVLLPDRKYSGFWHRILHDETADEIEREVSRLPHANVTLVPYHVRSGRDFKRRDEEREGSAEASEGGADESAEDDGPRDGDGETSEEASHGTRIADLHPDERARVRGCVQLLRVRPADDSCRLECSIRDGSGELALVFPGRDHLAGVSVGSNLVVEGTVEDQDGRLAMLDPDYDVD